MRRLVQAFACLLMLAASCTNQGAEKPKYMWMAVDNHERLSSRDSIIYYLDKCKDTGFNWAVLDVRGVEGVMYADNVEMFIEEAHARGMKVSIAATIFPAGSPYWHKGPVYDDPSIKDLTCVMYTPKGMVKIEDMPSEVAAFMNPLLPKAQEIAMDNIRYIFENFDLDGFALDYCRFPGPAADFSDATRAAFEAQIGQKLERWPEDVFSYAPDGSRVPGKYYKQWWKFRSGIIRDFVAKVKTWKDANYPDVELEYWAGSWLHALYGNGQNWASRTADYYKDYDWAAPDYGETGFAEDLDVFMTGAYLEKVWDINDLESMEYAMMRSNRDVAGACKMVGSFQICNPIDLADAAYVCLTQSEGMMAFDMCHTFGKPTAWDDLKRGIQRAEATREGRIQK